MAFNLDTNILLQGRGLDVGRSLQEGIKTSSMLEQLSQSQEEAPIRQNILEQLLAQREQEFDVGLINKERSAQVFQNQQDDRSIALEALKRREQQEQLAAQEAAENKNLKSIANTYSSIKGLVDSGKFNDAADALEANRKILIQSGATDLQDTDEAIAALRSGDASRIKNIKTLGEQAIQIATDRGLLGEKDSDERFSPTTTSLPGGISIQTTSTGRKVVTDAGGNILTGKAAIDAIKAAEKAEVDRAIQEAGGKRGAVIDAESGRTDIIAASKSAIASAVELAKESAGLKGETLTDLQIARASLPAVLDVVSQLKELAPVATSTLGGKVFDTASKELGFGATEGSTARAKFSSIVNNQILPLLKQTFGGAFTEAESDSLKATLGDVDASPSEKIAQLNAFIDGKIREIQTKERQLGQSVTPSSSLLSPEKSARLDELRKRNNL